MVYLLGVTLVAMRWWALSRDHGFGAECGRL